MIVIFSQPEISQSEFNQYNRDGYLVKKSLSDGQLMDELLQAFIAIQRKYNKEIPLELDSCQSWSDKLLTSVTLKFRQRAPDRFGIFYDALQNCTRLQALFTDRKIVAAAEDILSMQSNALSSTGHMLRIDVPEDTRNVLDWHQDSAYYRQNSKGDHGCVCLIPLCDIDQDNGTMQLLVGSHNETRLSHISRDEDIEGASQKYTIAAEVVKKYQNISLTAQRGDVIFTSMNLIHRSGYNSSNTIRFTTGIRFHHTLVEDFLPGRLIYRPNSLAQSEIANNSAHCT